MQRHLLDSHCHVRRCHLLAQTAAAAGPEPVPRDVICGGQATSCGLLRGALLCGTHPSVDWEMIRMVGRNRKCFSSLSLLTAFGVHPWYSPPSTIPPSWSSTARDPADTLTEEAPDASPPPNCSCASAQPQAAPPQPRGSNSSVTAEAANPSVTLKRLMSELEEALLEFPGAWVGEIGLDRIRGEQSTQAALFRAQMCLAAKYHRPISVHCVRSFGLLLDVLRAAEPSELPPVIVLHGYSGSLDFANSLAKIPSIKSGRAKIYFGIGSNTTGRLKTFPSLLASLPQDRLLLESDAHYEFLPVVDEGGNESSSSSSNNAGIVFQQPHEELPPSQLIPDVSSWTDAFLDALPPQALHDNFAKLISDLRQQA